MNNIECASIRIPCEWERQSAVWLTWPSQNRWWKDCLKDCENSFALLAAAISRFEKVCINCPKEKAQLAKSIIESCANCDMGNVEFFDIDSDDVWCRDSGAIFGKAKNGKLAALDFKYNSWGGKFSPWDKDDALASNMAKSAGAIQMRIDNFICEGGALEFGQSGELLTTECVLLNKNRNPQATRKSVEQFFSKTCGINKICWLKGGLANDDTDGHIDNIARFAPNNKIIACVCNKDNPSYEQLYRNFQELSDFENIDGKRFEIIPLPLPDPMVFLEGFSFPSPASYANWLVINGAVLVPQYGKKKTDEEALDIIGNAFPNREIIGLNSSIFLREGGAIHCLTQQQPTI